MLGYILTVGHSPQLSRTRALLLRSKGYKVIGETDCNRALILALHDGIDLLLLCHSLEKTETEFLVNALVEKRGMLPVLCVRQNDFARAPIGCESAGSAPDLLLSQIGNLVGRPEMEPNLGI